MKLIHYFLLECPKKCNKCQLNFNDNSTIECLECAYDV
jgi:hypothetical protein